MASRPTVRWNESAGRWMAWVRFPDGSRRKVERVEKADAQRDLDELVALRAQSLDPGPRRERLVSFAEVIEAWFEAVHHPPFVHGSSPWPPIRPYLDGLAQIALANRTDREGIWN